MSGSRVGSRRRTVNPQGEIPTAGSSPALTALQVGSSIGRASVSKTDRSRFES